MKQLALLLSGQQVEQPDLEPGLAPAIVSGFQVLWHPSLLREADFVPQIADIANPPEGDDRLIVIPKSIHDAADEMVRNDLRTPGTTVLTVEGEVGWDGPMQLARTLGLETGDEEILNEFFAVGYGYLGMLVLLWHLDRSEKLEEHLVWAEVTQAAEAFANGERDHARDALHAALDVLHGNRQSAYPATINVLDLALARPKDGDEPIRQRLDEDCRFNLIATQEEIDALSPETIAAIKEGMGADRVEVVGGRTTNRPWTLLPFESRVWEIAKGAEGYKRAFDREIDSFGSRIGSLSGEIPQLLMKFGVRYALHTAFDGTRFPRMRGPKIHWSCSDGSVVETIVRSPVDAGNESLALGVFSYLANSLRNDRSATLLLAHWVDTSASWYRWLIHLQRSVSLFGKFEKFSEYFLNATLPEGPTSTRMEEYSAGERTFADGETIASRCARYRIRQSFGAAQALQGLAQMQTGRASKTGKLEDEIEHGILADEQAIEKLREEAGSLLADSLLSSQDRRAGYLVVNPCAFSRRVGLELAEMPESLPIDSTVRAFERYGDKSHVIVDLPAWGYAWLPRHRADASKGGDTLEVVAKGHRLRNTQIEVEVDKKTGGIRGIWSIRDRYTRLAQHLAFSRGTKTVCRSISVTEGGKLVGEITTAGDIYGEDGRTVVATFQQRMRLWRGRPVLRVDMLIEPRTTLEGDPWENYFACRWGWADEKTVLLESSGPWMQSTHDEIVEATDFIELREQTLSTNIITGGLSLHKRTNQRQADTLLLVPGEKPAMKTVWIGLDAHDPFRLAQAEVWPVLAHPVDIGPGKESPTGTLATFKGDGVIVTSLAPTPDADPGLRLRMAETTGHTIRAEIGFAKPPLSAKLTNFKGEMIYDLYVEEDKISVDFSGLEWQQVDVTVAPQTLPADT